MPQLKIIMGESLASLSFAPKIVWIFFFGTSLQLAFLQPYIQLIPGERANVFSGLLCAITLGAILIFSPKALKKQPFEVSISIVLALLMVLSGLFSSTPGSSSARGFVILASGLGGFWSARALITSDNSQRIFLWFSFIMLAGILLLSLISYLFAGNVHHFLDANPHTLADRILLLWFAPLALLLGSAGPARIVAAVLLMLSYLLFYLSDLRSVVIIPVVLCLLAFWFGALRFKYLVVFFLLLGAIIMFFFQHLPREKIGKEFEPAYYRV